MLKTGSILSTLFLLNALIWIPLHWVHHLGPMFVVVNFQQNANPQHNHNYADEHQHSDASNTNQQQHKQQIEEYCWALNSSNNNYFGFLTNASVNITIPKQYLIATLKFQNALLKNRHRFGDFSPRGPPNTTEFYFSIS